MKVVAKWRNGWFVSLGLLCKLFQTLCCFDALILVEILLSSYLLFLMSVCASEVLTSKTTLPTTWKSKLETMDKQNSFLRRLEGNENVELEDICKELLPSMGYGCTCNQLSNGDVSLNCVGFDPSCPIFCDEDLERCGVISYSLELGPNGTPPNYVLGLTVSFEYTTGEIVAVAQSSCDILDGFPNGCSECVAFVNGEECTSCEMCEDGWSYNVDCENLATSSSFNECLSAPESGVFEGLGFYTCQYVAPTNDACSNATHLHFEVAEIGRTNGATGDSISSSCSLDDSKDVWYSVMGTGGTIVASTCSYDTYVGTTIDVFSGPDSCDDLECIAATKSGCSGSTGSAVSWPSQAGVTYSLRVATEEYDDQFEIVAFDLPPAENTGCVESAVLTSFDGMGSTLDLSDQLGTDICGEIGTAGLWYKVTAVDNGIMRASTCSNKTSISTAITIMTGDCETLTCVKSANAYEGTVGCSETGVIVDWNVTSGQTYFVYIRGVDFTGIFGVSIEALQVPNNDVCSAATVISSEDEIIEGNVENATDDFGLGTPCGEDSYITPRGVWYKITGSAQFLRAKVCSDFGDSVMSLYTGDCSNLVCAAESFYTYTNCESSSGRILSWEALEGVEYYLFIHSPYAPGSFELLLEEFEPVANSQCINAEGPLIPTNQTIIASTLNSVSDGMTDCVYAYNNSAGLWYSVTGEEGLTYRVDTCSEETNFGTGISIYTGSCDDELECVAGNDFSCGGSGSSVQWLTEEGVVYYIKIHGAYGEVGDFGMTFTSFATPKNDACSDSVVLSPTSVETVVVSIAGSTPDVIPGCFYNIYEAPGTWYQLEGNDKVISISSCSPSTNVATAIAVFSGSCEDLLCVSEGVPDYNCPDRVASRAIFLAEQGTTYFILLQSSDGYAGDVGLTISEFEGAENDFCQVASNVAIGGGEVVGSTVGASGGSISNECYFDPSTPDVWYFVDGTGDVLQATACSSEFTQFTMSVLQGTCTENHCIANAISNTELCMTVRFQSVIGETYFILFQALPESDTGTFSVSVNTSTVEGPENDLCSDAELVDPTRNVTIFGSTTEAITDFYEDVCWGASTSRDLWYKVVGNGAGMLASLCNPQTDFDSKLSIYSSSNENGSCSTLDCVASSDDACGGSGSQVWWLTEPDKIYLIRVHGFGYSFGNFALTIREQADELLGG
jgi:hypothetical protein